MTSISLLPNAPPKEGCVDPRLLTASARLACALAVMFPLLANAQPTGHRPQSSPIIDVHCHIHRAPRFRTSNSFEAAARAALQSMDKHGIATMIVMPPPFPENHRTLYDYRVFLPIVKQHPERFAFLGGGGALNPLIEKAVRLGRTDDGIKRMFKQRAEAIVRAGAVGFGEFAVEHFSLGDKHNHQSAPADHPLFLLLADIAAEKGVPIDIHLEVVCKSMKLPGHLRSPPNPTQLEPNLDALERLLTHNRQAKIIWSHVGWDNTGHRTPELTSRLLRQHPNLYMSFKISPRDSLPASRPVERGKGMKREWIDLMRAFPDRFMIGCDQFFLPPNMRRQVGPRSLEPTMRFASLLPRDVAGKIGLQNARTLFGLGQ